MERLQQIAYVVGIAAGSVTFVAGIVTTVVQLRKLPKGWHVSLLRWALTLSPGVLSALVFASFYFGAVRAAAGLMLIFVLLTAVTFARQPKPITRISIAWFVLSTVSVGVLIPAALILDLLSGVVENQARMVETQAGVLETQTKILELIDKLTGVPLPD